MEQRAPGHTVLDDKIYRKGMLDFKADIAARRWPPSTSQADPQALDQREQLEAMDIACDAVILFAERHAELAEQLAAETADPDAPRRAAERIAEVCRHVPAHAPRDFHEALQHYWFCHLGVITELNGWDSFSPGHLDQHLLPFYRRGLADGTLTRDVGPRAARVLLRQVQQPPGAAQGRRHRGGERHLHRLRQHQPRRAARRRLRRLERGLAPAARHHRRDAPAAAQRPTSSSRARPPTRCSSTRCAVIRNGYGFPSIFNADAVVEEQLRQGKTLEDARAGGCSGCVEVGAFGKEAYILTGYFNLVKVLELALHDGVDPRTGKHLGPRTGDPATFAGFDDLFAAFEAQLRHFVDVKIRGNQLIERMYADRDAGAVPLGAHRRLHRPRPGLQRRRRALQQHLHPGRRHRDASPTAWRPSRSSSSTSGPCRSPSSSPRSTPTSRARTALRAAPRQPDAQVRQRRRRGRRPDGAGLRRLRSRRSTAGRTRRAARTASRCCRPPATSTSAR